MWSEKNASLLIAQEEGPLPDLIRVYSMRLSATRARYSTPGLTTEEIGFFVKHATDWCARDEAAQLICKWAKASATPHTPGLPQLPQSPSVVVALPWFARSHTPAAAMFDVYVQNEHELRGFTPWCSWTMSVSVRDIVLHRIDALLTSLLLRHGIFRDLALLVGDYCVNPAQFVQSSFDAAFYHVGGSQVQKWLYATSLPAGSL